MRYDHHSMLPLRAFKPIGKRMTLEGGGKGDAPDAPDYSQIAAANEQAAKYAKESADADLAFRKEQYNDAKPRLEELYGLASQTAQQQLLSSQRLENQAQEQYDMYNSTYRPMELQTVLNSLGTQYLSDEDVSQAINYLTNAKYDETPIMAKRQKAIQDYVDEVTTSTETTNTSGGGAGLDNRYVQNFGMDRYAFGGNANATTGGTTTKNTTTTTKKPITRYEEEEYQAGTNKTLNSEFEKERAAYIDKLSKKAQENAALKAQEGTQAQVNSAANQQSRNLARMGLNPARMQAATAAMAQNQALTNAGAANQAREGVVAQQQNLQTGIANFGRNFPNTSGQQSGQAAQIGSSGVGAANTGAQGGLGYANYVSGATGNQINAAQMQQQGALGLGGLMNSSYGAQLNYAGNQGSVLGGILGAGLQAGATYMASDPAIKENVLKLTTLPDGLGVYQFEYKPEYKDTWGYGRFMGLMADEVKEVYPEAVAMHEDGYMMVDYSLIAKIHGGKH